MSASGEISFDAALGAAVVSLLDGAIRRLRDYFSVLVSASENASLVRSSLSGVTET